jgi:hypothetical protein
MADSKLAAFTSSLAHAPRQNLEPWLEEAETAAVNMCPQHDPTSALNMVANDAVWNQQPENLTNAAQVLAGTHAAAYRARPTWDMPNAHVNNAVSTVASIYRQKVTRHTDYTLAPKALAKALLDNIGDKNQVLRVAQDAAPDPAKLLPHSVPNRLYVVRRHVSMPFPGLHHKLA